MLLIFTILEFCIAVATANFWCRATRLSSNEVGQRLGGGGPKGGVAEPWLDLRHRPPFSTAPQAMLIVPSATRVDLAVPPADLPQPPSYTEVIYDPKEQPS